VSVPGGVEPLVLVASLRDELTAPIVALRSEMTSLGASIDRLAAASTRAGGGFDRMGAGARRATGEASLFGATSRKVGAGLSTGLAAGLGATVTAAKWGGAAVLAFGVASGISAVRFQDSMARVQGAARLSAGETKALGQALLATGGHSTFSAKQMAEALGPVAGVIAHLSGGVLTTGSAVEFLHSAEVLAEATGTKLGAATATLATVMQAYGLRTEDAASATNILFNVARSTGSSVDGLATVLARLHSRLGIAAPTLAQTGSLMVDLAQHGIVGSRGLMVVNGAISTLLGTSKPTAAAVKALGLRLFDAHGRFVGFAAVLRQLTPRLAQMSDKQRLLAETMLFGRGAAEAMNSVVLAGAPGLAVATRQVLAANAAQAAATEHAKTLRGWYEKLKSQLEDWAVSMGLRIMPLLTKGVAWLTTNLPRLWSEFARSAFAHRLLDDLNKAIGIGKQLWRDYAGDLGIAARIAGGALLIALTAVLGPLKWLTDHKDVTLSVLAGVAAGFVAWGIGAGAAAIATFSLSGAIDALTLAILANPIGAIAVAIGTLVAAVVLLLWHWRTVWHAIEFVAVGAYNFVRRHLLLIGEVLLGPVMPLIYLATHWRQVWGLIKRVVADVWTFIQPIIAAIEHAIGNVAHAVGNLAHAAGNVLHAVGNVAHAGGNVWHFVTGGGDTPTPRARGGDLGRTLAFHNAIAGAAPGVKITSGYRTWGLGSPASDHARGRALDLVGPGLGAYANAARAAGAFAEFHGSGPSRHLHMAVGDTPTPRAGGAGIGLGGVRIEVTLAPGAVVVQGSNATPGEIEDAVARGVRRGSREAIERARVPAGRFGAH